MPIIAENPVTQYLYNKAATRHVPLSGTFELTPVCNMSCRMCYVRMTAAEQKAAGPLHTAEQWLRLGRDCRDRGMAFLLVTGGEPLLHPQAREILTGLGSLGIVMTMNTNGTLIGESNVPWLKESGLSRLNITLYGASDETYARLCGNPKGFTQVSRAIELLRDAGLEVKINVSVTPHNEADLQAILEWCELRKLPVQVTAYMFPPVRRSPESTGGGDRFTAEQAGKCLAALERMQNSEEAFLKANENREFPSPPSGDCSDLPEGTVRCRAGKCSFWVTWQGGFSACGMFPSDRPELYSNVFELGIDEAWRRAVESTQAIRLPSKCEKCELYTLCHPCAAACISETGRFDAVPEYRCEMMRAYCDSVRKMVREIQGRE